MPESPLRRFGIAWVTSRTAAAPLGCADGGGPRQRPRRRAAGVAVLVAAAVLALAACGGPITPGVASLGKSGGSGGAGPKGHSRSRGDRTGSGPSQTANATGLLHEWTTCIRTHGDPNQSDPTVNATRDIEVRIPATAQTLANEVHTGTTPCSHDMAAASSALRNGQPPPPPWTETQAVRFTDCMRANGVPGYPDPTPRTPTSTSFRGTGVTPTSPTVKKATQMCTKKLGLSSPGTGRYSQAGVVQVRSGSSPPGAAPSGTEGPTPVTGGNASAGAAGNAGADG